MNLKEIKEMINLMNENGLAEIEIEKEGLRIKLRKTTASGEASPGIVTIERGLVSGPAKTIPAVEPPGETETKTAQIKAPMVGTFYRAPSPEAPPYVESGQVIEPGQVICIIEAMKLMNEIKSEIKGRIAEILVDNAEPV